MHRQLNEPSEIGRRFLFVFYIGCCITAIILGVMGLVKGDIPYFGGAALLGGVCFLFKKHGENQLHFKRLARSFPYGDAEDNLPDPIRKQVKSIFKAFHENHDWQQRLELRRKLTEMIHETPELLEIYPEEISAIKPNLASHTPHI